jgi:hypothetical protein
MKKPDPWFFEERAVAFASLVLTRHHDVVVRPHSGTDGGIDLLVEVRKGGKSTLRFFGVQVVASLDLPDLHNNGEEPLSRPSGSASEAKLPLCAFVIGVRKPEGVYRWAVEPVVEEGRALLRRETGANWQPLDEAGVARLIGQVEAWYDALNGTPTPKTRRRPSKGES